MATVQVNSQLEDQVQVVASPSATYAGVFDSHNSPDVARFINANLFSFIHIAKHPPTHTRLRKICFAIMLDGSLPSTLTVKDEEDKLSLRAPGPMTRARACVIAQATRSLVTRSIASIGTAPEPIIVTIVTFLGFEVY